MFVTKEIRCPKCNAIPEETGMMLASNPPYRGIQCSSTLCDWKGYIHQDRLMDLDFKIVDEI